MLRFAARRAFWALIVLVVIAYVSFLAQDFALHARTRQIVPAGQVFQEAARDCVTLVRNLARGEAGRGPSARVIYRVADPRPVTDLLGGYAARSLALLALAMALGGLVGGGVGLLAASWRRRGVAPLLLLGSIVGISAPSFLLGMLLQFVAILFYRSTNITLLPVGGFGWDAHLVLPVLVLAARPVAQVARLSYVEFSRILDEDYIRTARAKGLRPRGVWVTHVAPNAAITILTALGTSLRFSLSSLPVVEFLFGWPGIGRAMLDMLRTYQREGATVLILTLGAVFVGVNLLLDLAYRAIDPRLRAERDETRPQTHLGEWAGAWLSGLRARLTLRRRRAPAQLTLHPLPVPQVSAEVAAQRAAEARVHGRARWQVWRRALTTNPTLLMGLLLGALLLALVVMGPSLARHNVYTSGNNVLVNGVEVRPPAAPSAIYPLGTDLQGRDILSLLLVGARRTLGMAVLAVLARLAIGSLLGFLAGWFAGSRLDRAIMSAAEAIAAFPSLLLAMLVVYGVGVQQGLVAFVIALAVIGWGEVMQTVRSQVMAIKPMAYIESAVSSGLTEGQILTAHVLPNVWPVLVSVAFLEMGGVLMILGELGFLGVFIGGGLRAEGDGIPTLVYYDVPEWSVMLANSWRSFRSFPWATLYPALAFFGAILGFTLLGEGLRWLAERLTLSFRSVINRYTLGFTAVLALGLSLLLGSTGMYARYAPMAKTFDTARTLEDVRWLAQPELHGRLSGSEDANRVSEWLAEQFEQIGLLPSGEELDSYYQTRYGVYRDLAEAPTLVFTDTAGSRVQAEFGRDFQRLYGPYEAGGVAAGELIAIHERKDSVMSPGQLTVDYGLTPEDLSRNDRVFLDLVPDDLGMYSYTGYSGLLVLADQPFQSARYELLAESHRTTAAVGPQANISRAFAEALLAASGVDLTEITRRARADEPFYVRTGWQTELRVPTVRRENVPARNVIAIWPGEDLILNSEVVIVSAYYDGLGEVSGQALYPGANDNASGVATMLAVARTLKAQGFKPKRTILFVAWSGGERHRAVDYGSILAVRPAYKEHWRVVGALELEGVGAGTGNRAIVWRSSRERLTRVVRSAARQMRVPVTTVGAGLHADQLLWSAPVPDYPTAVISWLGSDDQVHLPSDTADALDPAKIEAIGRMTALAVMTLAADPAY